MTLPSENQPLVGVVADEADIDELSDPNENEEENEHESSGSGEGDDNGNRDGDIDDDEGVFWQQCCIINSANDRQIIAHRAYAHNQTPAVCPLCGRIILGPLTLERHCADDSVHLHEQDRAFCAIGRHPLDENTTWSESLRHLQICAGSYQGGN